MLWLEEHEHLSPREVATALEERSGLTALAGTGDMREVEAARRSRGPHRRSSRSMSMSTGWWGASRAMSAATGGLDVLVFTGGV
ncbi:MAG: hypothetical protein WKF47_16530 [Geodermatophilaceae bacterium]